MTASKRFSENRNPPGPAAIKCEKHIDHMWMVKHMSNLYDAKGNVLTVDDAS